MTPSVPFLSQPVAGPLKMAITCVGKFANWKNTMCSNTTQLIAMARKALSFLPQADQDCIFYKTALKLYPALARK